MARVIFKNNYGEIILRAFSNDPQGQAYMGDIGRDITEHAQMHAPVRPPRPGRPQTAELKNSFTYYLDRQGFFTKVVCQNTAPYAYYVHEGAYPHYISGRLRFFWESSPLGNGPDEWVRFSRVRHPGIAKSSTTPFFQYAAEGLGIHFDRSNRL